MRILKNWIAAMLCTMTVIVIVAAILGLVWLASLSVWATAIIAFLCITFVISLTED